jgi:amino acid transporter
MPPAPRLPIAPNPSVDAVPLVLIPLLNNLGMSIPTTNDANRNVAAIYVCCLAIQTSTIRLAFGMGRDGKLPLAKYYNNVSATLHTPVGTCIVIGVVAALPLIYYAGAGLIAIGATGMIYLS